MTCMAAWRILTDAALVSMLDTVRNRALTFVLEIEAQAPEAGETQPGVIPLPQEQVTQVFNQIILGGTNTIAAGRDFSQQTVTNVQPSDLPSLKAYVDSLGMASDDVAALEEAVIVDPRPETPEAFGPKAAAWLGRMTSKAASGAWKVASGAASDILTKALLRYYGLG